MTGTRSPARVAATLVTLALAAGGTAACIPGSAGGDAGPAPAGSGATGATGGVAEPAAATSGTDPAGAPSGTATTGLVERVPTDVVPVPRGATVIASAVQDDGDLVEVSLSGTSRASSDELVSFYVEAFRRAGFSRSERGTLAPGTGGRVYVRGEEVLVLAVGDLGEGAGDNARRSFSVGGTVRR